MKEKKGNKPKKDKVERKQQRSDDKIPKDVAFTDNSDTKQPNTDKQKREMSDFIYMNKEFFKDYFTLK